MPDPSWPSSPPEANYLRLVGAGAGGTSTTLASAAAWQALAAGGELAASVSSLNTAVTAADFEGLGGAASATRATALNTALGLLSGWAQQKPPIAASAVEAYHSAVAAMIPAQVSLANRAEQAANVALNPLVLGALTPAIVALDALYFGEYWPHNAGVGVAYGTTLAGLAAALAVPPPLTPVGASPSAPAAAAAAVAQAAGPATASEAMQHSAQLAAAAGEAGSAPAQAVGQAASAASQSATQPFQAAMSAGQPIMGMFAAPLQAAQELSGSAAPATPSGGFIGPAAGAGNAGAPSTIAPRAGSVPGGAAGAGIGGMPGSGLTSYARPSSAFSPEGPARPANLRAGLVGAADLKGPTTTANGTPGMVPAAAPHTGMLGRGKSDEDKSGSAHARVVVTADRPVVRRNS